MAGFENKYFFCLTKIKNKETRSKEYGARGLRFLTISLVSTLAIVSPPLAHASIVFG
jgi:hypothetical protein